MIKSEIRKKLFNRYFWSAFSLMLVMFLLGSAGFIFSEKNEETFISAIIAKLSGKWGNNQFCYGLTHLKSFWHGNEYTPVMMPIIVGLPGLGLYLDEIKSGNKRFVLSRTSRRNYYISKMFSSMLAAAILAVLAVLSYWVVLLIFFDKPHAGDSSLFLVYISVTGKVPEDVNLINVSELNIGYVKALISLLYFVLYAVRCALFTQAVMVIFKDSYLTLGVTVFFSYLQIRVSEAISEMNNDRMLEGRKTLDVAELFSPVFLCGVGEYGFFKNRAVLAVLLELLFTAFWGLVYITVSERNYDAALG